MYPLCRGVSAVSCETHGTLCTRRSVLLQPSCNLAKAAHARQLTWRRVSRGGMGWRRRRRRKRGAALLSPAPIRALLVAHLPALIAACSRPRPCSSLLGSVPVLAVARTRPSSRLSLLAPIRLCASPSAAAHARCEGKRGGGG